MEFRLDEIWVVALDGKIREKLIWGLERTNLDVGKKLNILVTGDF